MRSMLLGCVPSGWVNRREVGKSLQSSEKLRTWGATENMLRAGNQHPRGSPHPLLLSSQKEAGFLLWKKKKEMNWGILFKKVQLIEASLGEVGQPLCQWCHLVLEMQKEPGQSPRHLLFASLRPSVLWGKTVSTFSCLLPTNPGDTLPRTLVQPSPLSFLQISVQKSFVPGGLPRPLNRSPSLYSFPIHAPHALFTHQMLTAPCSSWHPGRWALGTTTSVHGTWWASNTRWKNQGKYHAWLSCVHCGLNQQQTA